MLVLSRQRDQTIMIGDNIEISVVDIRGDKVRLGISAPRSVTVHRGEIFNLIRDENRAAAASAAQIGGAVATSIPAVQTNSHPAEPAPPDPFLAAAIEEARKGLSEGGLPIGSVLVRNNQIIARGHNQRVQLGDPMAHAEIDCLRNAGRQKTYRDTVLYSTLMPCALCTGAALQFGIPRVVAGESVNFAGAASLLRSRGVIVDDRHDPECIEMMRKFIAEHPELWNEDIGK
jgi:cytosine deaminase